MKNYSLDLLTGKIYNRAKPAPMIAMPPRKDHIPVPNSGTSVKSNTIKPRMITEKPNTFLFLDVIDSMVFVISSNYLLYVLFTVILTKGIALYQRKSSTICKTKILV